MRKSRQEAAQTRARIVKTAAEEFRQHGIASTGLAEVMTAAGLTHGGFYKHFASKDALVAEAGQSACDTMYEVVTGIIAKTPGRKGIKAAVAAYLSLAHRDQPRNGCPFVTLGSELARADDATRAVSTAGFLRIVELLTPLYGDLKSSVAKKRAMSAAATMIGAVTMARVVNDESLSEAILRSAFTEITRSASPAKK